MKLDEKKLAKAEIDSISVRIYASRRIEYISDELEEEQKYKDPNSKYLIPSYVEIWGMNVDTGKEERIGRIRAYFFEPEILMEDSNFWEVCDAESGDLEAMAEAIIDENMTVREEICSENASIFYIDEIFINQEYRNLDIGSYVIQNLAEFFYYSVNLNIATIITMPYAMEGNVQDGYHAIKDEKQKQETLKKLIHFFRKNGFEQIENSSYYYKKV